MNHDKNTGTIIDSLSISHKDRRASNSSLDEELHWALWTLYFNHLKLWLLNNSQFNIFIFDPGSWCSSSVHLHQDSLFSCTLCSSTTTTTQIIEFYLWRLLEIVWIFLLSSWASLFRLWLNVNPACSFTITVVNKG